MYSIKKKAAPVATEPTPKRNRITKKALGDKADKVFDYIENNPKSTIVDIVAGMGAPDDNIDRALKLLLESERVTKTKTRPLYFSVVSVTPTPTEEDMETEAVRRSDAILQYASDHVNTAFSMKELAEATDIPVGSIYQEVYRLQKRKLLDKKFNKGNESTSEPEAPQKPLETVTEPSTEPKSTTLSDQIEFLVWNFVRETRSTDVLAFLSWIEAKNTQK